MEEIVTLLGEPYYRHKSCLLYNMDCVDALKQLSASKHNDQRSVRHAPVSKRAKVTGQVRDNVECPLFDLTVTSPPYNIGKEYEDHLDVNKYVAWCEQWMGLVYDLTAPQGSAWINLGYLNLPERGHAVPLAYLLWDRSKFFFQQEVVWNYGAGVACKKYFSPRNEKILWFVKDPNQYTFNLDNVRDPNVKYPNQKKNGRLRCNPLGKNPTDVWQIPKVTSGRASSERTSHPAQYPEELVRRIVLACSDPGDLILDPFLGSGTTAKVALELGRSVVGFELKEDYCRLSTKRLEKVKSCEVVASQEK